MKNYPFRIAAIYFLMASAWIFLSDRLVQQKVPAQDLTTVQSIKGFAFVIVSAMVLYLLTRYYYSQIQKNEREYRKLFKDNPYPMYVFDIETLKFLTVNDAAIAKYGYRSEEFRNMNMTEIRPPEEKDAFLMFLKSIEGKPYHDSGIWQHQDKSGKRFYVRIASHSTTFGRHKARVVLALDIDEQIQAQNQVELSESKLHGLINNSDDLIWMVDKAGLVVAANDPFKEKFNSATGLVLEIAKKINITKLPPTWHIDNWGGYMKDAFEGKKLRIEQEIITHQRKEWFEIILIPIYNKTGEVFNVGFFARDITQRKEAENKIKEQVRKLQEVAWMQSHEVRKPLANILGILDLVQNGKNNEEDLKTLLNHMKSSCLELDAIINKIVSTSSSDNSLSTQA